MSSIDLDHQIYALYRVVWERWGDEAWYVVWRSGDAEFRPNGLAMERWQLVPLEDSAAG